MNISFLLTLTVLVSSPLLAHYQPHLHPATLHKDIIAHAQPRRRMLLCAQVSGPIHTLDLDLGDTADGTKGFTIDNEGVRLQILRLQSLIELRKSELSAQEVRLQQEEGELQFQDGELSRIQKMLKSGGATEQQWQQQAHAVEQQKLMVLGQKAQMEMLSHQLEQTKIEKRLQEDLLARHRGIAPQHWHIISRFKEVGEFVAPGEAVLELVQLTPQRVSMMLNDVEADALRRGKVDVQRQGRSLKWTLLHISPQIDPVARKRKAELLLTSLEADQTGKEVILTFSLPDPQQGILVPDNLIHSTFGQKMVLTQNGTQLPIKIMRKEGDHWVISPDQIPPGTSLILPSKGDAQP